MTKFMNAEQSIALNIAWIEYNDDGLLSTSTFMALTTAGFDAELVLTAIEEAYYGRV